MKKIDSNRDGTVGIEEWDLAVKSVQQKLIEDELINIEQPIEGNVVIAKSKEEKIFMLSEQSQKDLLAYFSRYSKLKIFGGPLLACLSIYYLIYSFQHEFYYVIDFYSKFFRK